ncbi:MAG: HEPN domain-containing protein [Armatimonadia bacterium]
MSEAPSPEQQVVLEWLQSALEDIRVARRCMAEPPAIRALFFHVQQAAEKALKAYLVGLGHADFPRTHLLRDLAARIVEHGGVAPQESSIAFLDTYTVGVRYPDSYTPPAEVADKAIQHAVQVIQRVLDQLGLPGPDESEAQTKLQW